MEDNTNTTIGTNAVSTPASTGDSEAKARETTDLPMCPDCQQGFVCEHCGKPIGDYYTAAPGSPSPAEPTCAWTLDDLMDGDLWETGCGETFQFTDGGPDDNKFMFCYKCGKRIDAARYSDFASVGEESK